MRSLLFLLAICFLGSCAYGPKTEHKSPLNFLSGEHYENDPNRPADALVLPVAKRKQKESVIRGTAFLREGLAEIPLKHIPLTLFAGSGKKLLETHSELDGKFRFKGSFENGRYEIRSQASVYEGQIELGLEGFELDGVKLELKTKSDGGKH